jgi:phage protein D
MADTQPRTGFYAARPVIRIDGQAQPDLGQSLLLSLLAEETTLGLFRCEARFLNWGPKAGSADFLLFDGDVIDFGKTMSIEIGPPSVAGPVFAGRITGMEAQYPASRPPELTVLAEDRFQDLRMTRRTRSFEDVSDADVIRQIASQQGLTAKVDVDGPTYRSLAQVNQSDLAFLRERVAAIDAHLWIDNQTLYAQSRSKRKTSDVSLSYGSNLLEFSVLADLAHQRTRVHVCGWDVGNKAAIDKSADVSTVSGELDGGRSGSAVLGNALAERVERIETAMPLSTQEAMAMAKARYLERARRFLCGTGLASGEPKLRVGTVVDLQGLGTPFNGKYFVTRARHTFDSADGYRTEFDVERPGLGT